MIIPEGQKSGVTTDVDGRFAISAPIGKELKISFVGYRSKNVTASDNMGIIKLEPDNRVLQDVVVTQSVARTRLTPVAATIETKLC